MSFLNFSAISLLLADHETVYSLLLCLPPGKHGGETPFIAADYSEMRPWDTQSLQPGFLTDSSKKFITITGYHHQLMRDKLIWLMGSSPTCGIPE